MAITYPVTMPTSPAPTVSTFGAAFNNVTHLSLNNTRQVIRRPGDLMIYEFDLPPMLRAQAAPWQAFGMSLKGTFGTFYAKDPDASTALGAATGSWLVKGASQVGDVLIVDGAPISTADVFKAGDWFSVNDRMHMVLADAASDGAGEATLDIAPGIPAGAAPADNTAISYGAAGLLRGIFRMVDDSVTWRADHLSRYGMKFRAVQAVNT